jgi:CubicO group peptidase (beta-lactamase class C family)
MAMRTKARTLVTFAIAGAVGVAAPVSAQTLADHPQVAEALRVVDIWLEAMRAYEQIPGISAAIVHDQVTIWSGAHGFANPDRQLPATSETLYSICSISKLFTAVAVMQLRDQGLLALSDPIDRHVPWFRITDAHPGSPPVTVAGILTHAAGLPRESDHPYWSAPDFRFPTREEIIAGLANQETLYPTWRYYQYSNLGLTLAGEIVREGSGMSYEEYVQRRILDPLGLSSTRPYMPEELWGGALATGYGPRGREGERRPLPFFHARGVAPAAGFSSNALDLARFAAWQFRLRGDAEEVLRAHTLQEMQRVHYVDPSFDTYRGLGFGVYRMGETTFVGHFGSCPGYNTQLLLQMDDRIAIIFMANANGVNTARYARAMHALVAPALKNAARERNVTTAVPAAAPAAASSSVAPDLDRYLGSYDYFPWGGETAVVHWRGKLALLYLPTDDPARALTKLEHVEGHTFRRVRDDDQPGETVRFEVDAQGRATTMVRYENRYPRIR